MLNVLAGNNIFLYTKNKCIMGSIAKTCENTFLQKKPAENYILNYSYVTIPSTTCTESWTCDEWSECISGVQTRTYISSCGTTAGKSNMRSE